MAGVLSGCAIAGKPVAAPVTDEWRDAVVEAVGDLGAHMGPVSDAMAPTNYPALHASCRDLRSYLDTMQRTVLPGPDVNVNSALREGIEGYRSMADQCMALTPSTSPAELRKLSDTIDDAHEHIVDGLKLLGIQTPG